MCMGLAETLVLLFGAQFESLVKALQAICASNT